MNDSQFSVLFFFVVGIGCAYKGLTLLFQSVHQEEYLIWYKRVKLPGGFSCLLLGLVAIITTGIDYTGVSMPLGNIGWDLIIVLLELPMFLLGILSWWNKVHISSRSREGRPTEDVHD